VAATLTVRLLGKPWEIAVPVGAAFSQVGEFSFILGVLARQLGLLTETGWDALVIASILSIALNPVLYGWARKASSRGGASVFPSSTEAQEVDPQRCVMVGYGPVGRTVHRILADWGAKVTVVELSLETVRKLRSEEVSAVYGDALKPGILEEAGLASAGTLILTAEMEDAVDLVKAARAVNPKLRVLARTGHLRELPALRKAGATVVVGEAEVAVALAKASMLGNEAGLNAFAEQREDLLRRLYEEPLT
jgi:CPA2 family monovalent cation:H+ antiporter-2